MGFFKIKQITKVQEIKDGTTIPESDYSLLTNNDEFIQFQYVREDDELDPYTVKPGIYSIAKALTGYTLQPSSFEKSPILEEYIHTKEVTDKINKFFSRLDIWKRKERFPKRSILLYGKPGLGKSESIARICDYYNDLGRTAILIWHTDKFEPSEVKDFIKSFVYDGVDKFILVAEDIGGIEMDEIRMKSDSSLLSLLDNKEKTFSIPTLILATTNHPEIFLDNLTNRPGRFDVKIEVKAPPPEYRSKFLSFFAQNNSVPITDKELKMIEDKKYSDLSIAHIIEIVDRSELDDISIAESIEQVYQETQKFKNAFQEKKKLGFGFDE